MDNLAEQCDEIEALKSIYPDLFTTQESINSFCMKINQNVQLYITLNEDYPSRAPPSFELLAPTLTLQRRQTITNEFNTIYANNKGSPILYQWIEKLKELTNNNDIFVELNTEKSDVPIQKEKTYSKEVYHGEIIQDRKSVFQGHASAVYSLEDTKSFLDFLLENKKISQATHNITAYKIQTSEGTILQDCDDDGETHAGGRVLHLLQILNVTNVMVVVSRWYGGIHLGPDRFKHINNAARHVLLVGNFIKRNPN